MKLSVNWLNEFTPILSLPFETVLDKVYTSICEIDEVEEFKVHLSSVITVKISEISPHPNAEKLRVTKCSDGKKTYQIVTAAENVKVGDIVPLALPGTVLDGKTIADSELRGVPSSGMYCSEKELGMAIESSGVLILPSNTELGLSVRQYFDWEDRILVIDNKSITHRPDLWSHFGFARELSFQLNLPLDSTVWNSTIDWKKGNDGLEVKSTNHAHAYFISSIQNVKITESQKKFKSRLEKCGIRSINNVVDVSNYLLLELGQPNHFFDRAKCKSNSFSVDKTSEGESFLLLDDTDPKLQKDILVIRNGGEPVALAGIMGGLDSAVSQTTTKLVMESAVFRREDVRFGIRKTNIRSESAVRYEKGLDSFTCLPVIGRAVQLLKENGCPDLLAFEPVGFNHSPDKQVTIATSLTFLQRKLGKEISLSEVERILTNLGFDVSTKGDVIQVIVPRFRHNYDITIPEDLVEEIGRTIGYASIQTIPLKMAVETPIRYPLRELERKIKQYYSLEAKFNEVFNYSFSSKQDTEFETSNSDDALGIANDMPEEQSYMRTSLYPGLIRQAVSNQDRFPEVQIFEIGRTYFKSSGKKLASEKRTLGVAIISKSKHSDLEGIETEFLSARDKFFQLFSFLNLRKGSLKKTERNYFHPNAGLEYIYDGRFIGEFGILHERYADQFDLKRRAFIGKVDLEYLVEIWEKEGRFSYFQAPSQFPEGELDLSVVMNDSESTSRLAEIVSDLKIPELKSMWVHTIYRGDSIGTSQKSVTYRFQLMSYDKTFTQDRFKEISDLLVNTSKSNGFAIR
ncbi:MAG: phenylalanine--tRNA ligase subunit beta [Leptospira sp.]|nr:phenylalanine--tRNA ligase subunit beta [Leptospira sp.]